MATEVHYIKQDPNQYAAKMELIKTQIQNADSTDITNLIGHLESEWHINKLGDSHIPFNLGFEKFLSVKVFMIFLATVL